jgi:serine/threonine protein phosphatase 1
MFDASSTFGGGPQLRPGRRIYAVGDVHGRFDLLSSLVLRIRADLGRFPVAAAELIFLGDYISRGPASAAVLDFLIEDAPRLPLEVTALKGNHEDALLRFVDGGDLEAGRTWLHHGGTSVLSNYDLAPTHSAPINGTRTNIAPTDEELAILAAQLRRAMPSSHLALLRSLTCAVERDDYLFVHAGLRPGRPLAGQEPADMMWIREEFLTHELFFERFVVHGHTPTRLPDIRRNRVNVDTKAFESGMLTCVVLERRERRFLASA